MDGAGNTVLTQPEYDLPAEDGGGGVTAAGFGSAGEDESSSSLKRRGRPRKQTEAAVPEYSAPPSKRGRGRPRGSGKWQTLAASLGGSIGDSAGTDFTPCILSIQEGENIVQKIWSFSHKTPDSICILSASGTISTAEIYVPPTRSHFIRYEGHFSLINLNGSHTLDEKRGGKICLLSVQLANPEGCLYGGAVASSLIAGGPTQVIIATFRQKQQHMLRPRALTIADPGPVQAQSNQMADVVQLKDEGLAMLSAPTVGPASPPLPPLPIDWKAFEPLIESRSERVMSSGLGN